MNQERWGEIKQNILSSFEVRDQYTEDLDPGSAEVIEFDGPQGLMQVKFITRPRLLDKKTSYSNRAGSNVKVDYVFSETDFVSHLEIFTWSETRNDWQKLEAPSLFD